MSVSSYNMVCAHMHVHVVWGSLEHGVHACVKCMHVCVCVRRGVIYMVCVHHVCTYVSVGGGRGVSLVHGVLCVRQHV